MTNEPTKQGEVPKPPAPPEPKPADASTNLPERLSQREIEEKSHTYGTF